MLVLKQKGDARPIGYLVPSANSASITVKFLGLTVTDRETSKDGRKSEVPLIDAFGLKPLRARLFFSELPKKEFNI